MDKERKKGIQIHRGIVYGSHARLLTEAEKASGKHPPGHTHQWTVFFTSAATPPPKFKSKPLSATTTTGRGKQAAVIEDGEVIPEDIDFITGGADDLSWLIKRVAFKLHETYTNSNRNVDKPPFRVTETGWGEFSIAIRVQFQPETSEKTLSFSHMLKLHHWGPTASAAGTGAGLPGAGADEETVGDAGETRAGTEAGTPGRGGGGAGGDADEANTRRSVAPSLIAGGGIGGGEASTPSRRGVSEAASRNPKIEEETPTPGGEADTSALTAPPDEEDTEGKGEEVKKDKEQDVNMEDGDANGEKDAEGEDDDADAEGEDDEDAEGEVDESGAIQGNLTNDQMDVDGNDEQQAGATSVNGGGGGEMSGPSTSFYINPLPVHSWQYDEIIFADPTPQFYELLLAHEPSKLPLRSRRKPDDEGAGALINEDRGSAGVPLEFTLELERAEANKMDEARRKVVEETDKWRQKIIELEREQTLLKDQLAGY